MKYSISSPKKGLKFEFWILKFLAHYVSRLCNTFGKIWKSFHLLVQIQISNSKLGKSLETYIIHYTAKPVLIFYVYVHMVSNLQPWPDCVNIAKIASKLHHCILGFQKCCICNFSAIFFQYCIFYGSYLLCNFFFW